jgi:hypothetical protein
MSDSDFERETAFIATLPRSGSTLLGMMLHQHPAVYHVGESFYWGGLPAARTWCSCGKCPCPDLVNLEETLLSPETSDRVLAIGRTCAQLDLAWAPKKSLHKGSLSRLFRTPEETRGLDASLRAAADGLNVVASSYRFRFDVPIIIDNSKFIDLAPSVLENPNAKLIILYRDPRGIASSYKRAGERKGVRRNLETLIPVLIRFMSRAREILDRFPARTIEIRYEDLVRSPQSTLQSLSRFMGINYHDSLLQFRKHKGHTLGGNRMRLSTDPSDLREDLGWRQYLTHSDLHELSISDVLVSSCRPLGYDLA